MFVPREACFRTRFEPARLVSLPTSTVEPLPPKSSRNAWQTAAFVFGTRSAGQLGRLQRRQHEGGAAVVNDKYAILGIPGGGLIASASEKALGRHRRRCFEY